MRVLLLAMPDVASSFDRVMRMPNLGLSSLAANVGGAEVRILDLVLRPRGVGRAVREALDDFRPDLVGLSAMTFQYDTAKRVAAIVREALPQARTVLGGYHATLAYDEIAADPEAHVFDFLVRGEGEVALDALVRSLRAGGPSRVAPAPQGRRGGGWEAIPGLSYRTDSRVVHNPRGPLLDLAHLRLPARDARMANGFHYFGRRFDVVETSRGCTHACRFCSIREMYGTAYRAYPLERVIADISAAAAGGAQGIFFTDDNINLDTDRLQQLCEAIVEAGLHGLEYITQADVAGFARAPHLPAAMQRSGFRGVFLGIESVDRAHWRFLRKSNSLERTREVVRNLRAHGITVAGGFIVGNPDDDAGSVRSAFRLARSLGLDHAIMWCLTPYPGTEVRDQLLAEGLVTNPGDYSRYNGFICNLQTRHLGHNRLVRLIASEGLKLYFHPAFSLRGRVWPRRAAIVPYVQASLEYLTRGYRNRLYASRHRM